ncbi:MAG: hypothetical protein HN348_15350, partial [Proteobacteria bacterium]|nr:hypothetical protein [Pseudomonadota bacterium]
MGSAPQTRLSWSATIQKRIADSEYKLRGEQGRYQAVNRAQNFHILLDAQGLQLTSKGGGNWQLGLRLVSWGRPGRLKAIGLVEPAPGPCGNSGAVDEFGDCLRRMDAHHQDIIEWWQNDSRGLEHGWTIVEPPRGDKGLVLDLAVSGMDIEIDDERSALLTSPTGEQLRYGGLVAFDAEGRHLSATMTRHEAGLRILIDDNGASWPITVDPLLQMVSWTVESNQQSAIFGDSVSLAGDVNGDGFGDVIVGAPYYNNGEEGEGRAFVYLGSNSGLSLTPIWTAESDLVGASFGHSVAAAGDVDSDGYGDIVVGSPYYTNGENTEGRAWVFNGSAAGPSVNPTWIAESNQVDARFGEVVSGAGDVNNDGYGDVIVAAPNHDAGQGGAYLYVGSLAGLETTPSWVTESEQDSAYFGRAVSSAGDIDGDGYGDVIITGYEWDNGDSGHVYVYRGVPSPDFLSESPQWTIDAAQTGSDFGGSVAAAGDVNGDGFADIIVGASNFTNDEVAEGKAYVYFGSVSGASTTADWSFESNLENSQYGHSVSSAGDVNGDGYADIVVGAVHYDNGELNEGAAFLYLGSGSGPMNVASWVAESNQGDGFFGRSVSSAGDVNGDGFADVIVGMPQYASGQSQEGAAHAYRGIVDVPSETTADTRGADESGAYFGAAVSSAGDVNGDGYDDVIVGAPNHTNDQGRAYIYRGSASGISASSTWVGVQGLDGAMFGKSVSRAGDVNSDGYDDVIVGAPRYDNGQAYEGTAYLHLGSPSGLSISPSWMIEGDQEHAELGNSVSSAGDVNGDGHADVIVGVWQYGNGETKEGRAQVYLGTDMGLELSPNWVAESDQEYAYFGSSVASAGDVNGDGYGDVVVGAYGYDNAESDEGAVFVYLGSATGLSTSPDWQEMSGIESAYFGWAVASAGDINADGYSDIIVGAYAVNNEEGAAYVYLGSDQGLKDTPYWTYGGDEEFVQFGYSVASAGDIDHDGYGDIIVGAREYSNGDLDEGRASIFLGSDAGLTQTPAWNGEPNQSSAFYGYSLAGAGDINGDGYGDLVIGVPNYDNKGYIYIVRGNSRDDTDAAFNLLPQARQPGTTTALADGGISTSGDSFDVAVDARCPFGRSRVKLQIEAKPLGSLFDGVLSVETSSWTDIGQGIEIQETVTGLSPETPY